MRHDRDRYDRIGCVMDYDPAATGSSEAKATAVDLSISDQDLRVPCYCEENVWRLLVRKLQHATLAVPVEYYVAFISNDRKAVVMQNQKASGRGEVVCWDYHVILLSFESPTDQVSSPTIDKRTIFVYDIDTRLQPYPILLSDYLEQSFPKTVAEAFRPQFRIIPGEVFLTWFTSDRRHMWDSKERRWSATPPSYTCISNTTTTDPHTLKYYLNFTKQQEEGYCPLPKKALGVTVTIDVLSRFDQWRSWFN